MAAGTVSATFDARQRATGHERPGSRSCLGGRVLTSTGYDNAARWREGDRLEWLFERRCDWLRRQGRGRHLAVDVMDGTLSYLGLDARANQLARFMVPRACGRVTGSGCCPTGRWTATSACWRCLFGQASRSVRISSHSARHSAQIRASWAAARPGTWWRRSPQKLHFSVVASAATGAMAAPGGPAGSPVAIAWLARGMQRSQM